MHSSARSGATGSWQTIQGRDRTVSILSWRMSVSWLVPAVVSSCGHSRAERVSCGTSCRNESSRVGWGFSDCPAGVAAPAKDTWEAISFSLFSILCCSWGGLLVSGLTCSTASKVPVEEGCENEVAWESGSWVLQGPNASSLSLGHTHPPIVLQLKQPSKTNWTSTSNEVSDSNEASKVKGTSTFEPGPSPGSWSSGGNELLTSGKHWALCSGRQSGQQYPRQFSQRCEVRLTPHVSQGFLIVVGSESCDQLASFWDLRGVSPPDDEPRSQLALEAGLETLGFWLS